IRVARQLNGALGRSGAVFGESYHARALTTPRETRHALAYVLLNHQKHMLRSGRRPRVAPIDPCSSAAGFGGWIRRVPRAGPTDGAVVPARTWLLARVGAEPASLTRSAASSRTRLRALGRRRPRRRAIRRRRQAWTRGTE